VPGLRGDAAELLAQHLPDDRRRHDVDFLVLGLWAHLGDPVCWAGISGRSHAHREAVVRKYARRRPADPKRNYAFEWRRWRKAQKLTQGQLADILCISESTVSNIERRKTLPCVSSRMAFCALQLRYKENQCPPPKP
jgi:DNA-binding transcriptional regulator YiaG